MLVGEIMTSPAFTVRDDARPLVAVQEVALLREVRAVRLLRSQSISSRRAPW
ncbi:MAG: hypothetical protein M3Y49_18855 [Actinomycetota bacterium]|nr:hypothetical protein [Actinomycetota bacterium]